MNEFYSVGLLLIYIALFMGGLVLMLGVYTIWHRFELMRIRYAKERRMARNRYIR
jgi:hypothetical protein